MNYALAQQINALEVRADGWFDDDTEAYAAGATEWLSRLLDRLVSAFKLPTPYVYPTRHGVVRAGWLTARWEVIADIDLATHRVAVQARRSETHVVRERELQLEAPGAETVLGRFVAGHAR